MYGNEVKRKRINENEVIFNKNLQGALSGSKTNTVVAAKEDPSSLLPGLPVFTDVEALYISPGHASSAHTPTHWATSHWMCTSEPTINQN